jgi:hypothetical protein
MGAPRTMAIALGLLALSACTALPGGARIENYAADEARPAFGGLLLGVDEPAPSRKIRYIFHIHGMGLTARDPFHDGLFNRLVDAGYTLQPGSSDAWLPSPLPQAVTVQGEGLNCGAPWRDSVPAPKPPSRPAEDAEVAKPCEYASFGSYRVDRLVRAGTGDEIRLYSYFWHRDLWRMQEPYLRLDMSPAGRQGRGGVTNLLKYNTVDGGLSDASAYTGPMGDLVRAGVGSTLCIMMRDAAGPGATYAQSASNGLSTCLDGAGPEQSRKFDETEFGFVTHSLGSRMLFDTLFPDDPTVEAKIDAEVRAFTVRSVLLKRTRSVYMAANQLPLLATGRVTTISAAPLPLDTTRGPGPMGVPPAAPPGPAPAPAPAAEGCPTDEPFFTRLCQAGARPTGALGVAPSSASFSNVEIISFHDPDDLLGFKASGGYRRVTDRLTFVDIVHRNTPQILWAFAVPTEAHDQELNRKSSLDLILCGGVASPKGQLKARDCLGKAR